MAHHPFASPEVEAVFAAYPQSIRKRMLVMRDVIFAAAKAADVGELTESLKWGEPAWRPKRMRTGSTVRLAPYRHRSSSIAMFVHCQTGLADEFREAYPGELEIENGRAVIFDATQPLPEDIMRHCAALAFTYHLRRR